MTRLRLIGTVTLAALLAVPAAAQRGRTSTPNRSRDRGDEQSSSDTRFTPNLRSGQRLSVSNIDGAITVTQGRGESAEIIAHKIVRRGDGELVRPVLEETSNGYRVCTVYLDARGDDARCDGDHRRHGDRREPLDVDVEYTVRIPAGVALTVNTVDGDIEARGLDTPAELQSVDGSITFDGVAPQAMHTVDGKITARITDRDWSHNLAVHTVDGAIDLTLPASINARISGSTVDGGIDSDFPLTVNGRFGPKSMKGDIGDGRGPSIQLSTVDGEIRLRSSDGVRRDGGDRDRRDNSEPPPARRRRP